MGKYPQFVTDGLRPGDAIVTVLAMSAPTPVRRRAVSLPGTRAVVGGLLVALSALGVIAAHRAATTVSDRDWLVARRHVAAGTVITADDLALAPMSLAAATEAHAVADPEVAIGTVALAPLERGELVQRSAIAAPAEVPESTGRRLGVELATADAVGGTVAAGDRVDVVAVPTDGEPPEVVVTGALVVDVLSGDDRLGASGGIGVVLDVPDAAAARRIVGARAAGGVTLVGATPVPVSGDAGDGADGGGTDGGGTGGAG